MNTACFVIEIQENSGCTGGPGSQLHHLPVAQRHPCPAQHWCQPSQRGGRLPGDRHAPLQRQDQRGQSQRQHQPRAVRSGLCAATCRRAQAAHAVACYAYVSAWQWQSLLLPLISVCKRCLETGRQDRWRRCMLRTACRLCWKCFRPYPPPLCRLAMTSSITREPWEGKWCTCIVCTSQAGTGCRVELVQLLISEAKRKYPRNITFHFNSPCEGWNLGAREVHLATPYGDSSKAGTLHNMRRPSCRTSPPGPAPWSLACSCAVGGLVDETCVVARKLCKARPVSHPACLCALMLCALWLAQTYAAEVIRDHSDLQRCTCVCTSHLDTRIHANLHRRCMQLRSQGEKQACGRSKVPKHITCPSSQLPAPANDSRAEPLCRCMHGHAHSNSQPQHTPARSPPASLRLGHTAGTV